MQVLKNKFTKNIIAQTLSDLPPVRDGRIRLVHQTVADQVSKIVNKGLIYNKERFYGKPDPHGLDYHDVRYMTWAFYEDEFWDMLQITNGTLYRNSDKKVIFDVPEYECGAHQSSAVAPFLSGCISAGYIIGVINNYGTKLFPISKEEVLKASAQSKKNPLPTFYETPDWEQNIESALEKMKQRQMEFKSKLQK